MTKGDVGTRGGGSKDKGAYKSRPPLSLLTYTLIQNIKTPLKVFLAYLYGGPEIPSGPVALRLFL